MAAAPDDDTTALPFPPVTKAQILHCSYHYWHPKYRNITPKARLIPLTQPFLDYLRKDSIILADDDDAEPVQWDSDSGVFSSSDNPDAPDDSDDEQVEDVTAGWREVHQAIKDTIAELGGKVMPKLNWSAPKDAAHMNANTLECRAPNDIYLLLKSSEFITFDLECAFKDCVDSPGSTISTDDIPYHLVLRKAVPTFNPSVEFRCFVRERKLLCICQRDLNHFDFLFPMRNKLRSMIIEFFEVRLRDSFPDKSFTFDVYIPQTYNKVWLIDFNPWAPRTDPLLFSWLELLEMDAPLEPEPIPEGSFARLYFNAPKPPGFDTATLEALSNEVDDSSEDDGRNEVDASSENDDEEDADEELYLPELRLVHNTDPEAYSFATSQYSAYKLPTEVVVAGQSGEGLREFARDWQSILEKRRGEDVASDSSGDDDGDDDSADDDSADDDSADDDSAADSADEN